MVDLGDELRHAPGPEPEWGEHWHFEVAGLSVRLTLRPNLRRAWWWTEITRAGEQLLRVRDDELDLPRRSTLEVRGAGLWADVHCHQPLQRWQVNFEGIMLALDDPCDTHGHPTAVEFEFEWEAASPPLPSADGRGYTQDCVVHGEAQIKGGDALAFDVPVPGRREHAWGVRDYNEPPT